MFNENEWRKEYRKRLKAEGRSYYQKHRERILAKRKTEYRKSTEESKIADLEGEEWRPLVGYEHHYQVSNMGRIKSSWHMKETLVNGSFDKDGYRKITLTNEDRSQDTFRRARLVAITWVPNPGNRPEIDHINTDRTDDRAANLRWVSSKENKANEQSVQNRSKVDYGFNRGKKLINGKYQTV